MADKTLASLVFPGLPDRYVVPDYSADIEQIKEDLSAFQTATSSDVGKALKAKTVTNGKITEWEFGDAGGAVDATLSVAGEAADAKVVGDALSEISENENLFDASLATDGYRIATNGRDYNDAEYYVSNYIPVTAGITYTKNSPSLDAYHRMGLYTASKTFSRIIENSNSVIAQTGEAYIRFCGLLTEKHGATLYASNGVTAVDKTARSDISVNEKYIASLKGAFKTGTIKELLSWAVGSIDSTGLIVASNNRILTPVAYNFGAGRVIVSFPDTCKVCMYTYNSPEMIVANFVRRTSDWSTATFAFDADSQYYYAFVVGHVDNSEATVSEGESVVVETSTMLTGTTMGEISDVTFPNVNKGLVCDNTADFGRLNSSSIVSTSDYISTNGCNVLLLKVPYYQTKTSYGLIFYDESKNAIRYGCPFNYYGSYGVEFRRYPVPYNAKFFRFSYFSDTSTYGEFVGYRIQDYPTKPYIFVAASDSSKKDKHTADFVCDGENDEVELQHAIYTARGEVVLAEGTYYIDSFQNTEGDGTVTALHFGKYGQQVIKFAGTGIGGTRKLSTTNVLFGGATIRVSRNCYDSLDDNTQYAIFGSVTNGASRIYPNVTASIENINFVIPDNQKKIICIDGWMMGALSFKNIKAIAVADGSNLKKPVDGCIGIRGLQGSNFGCGNRWESAFVWGFYEGYAVSGEHIVGADLGARYCNYGFTFNRKPITTGALLHPITMINCCDECNFNLPVFGKGGESRATDGLGGRQTINLIDFNMEWLSSYYRNFGGALATELEPGQVYGSITYTVQTNYGGNTKNNVSQKFWATGSGMNVRTKNMAHAQSGTTAERNSYGATYMQTYYDTDLNKLLIYDGSNWRDMAGLIIS